MIRKEELVKIGRIKKPHGIKGEMLFEFTDDSFDESECFFLILELDAIFVPFLLEDYYFKSNSSAIIKFKNIDTEEKVRTFTSKNVYFPKKYIRNDFSEEITLWDHYINYALIDENNGKIGIITEINDSTINTLFVVAAEKGEILIPASEEYITHVDEKQKELFVSLPEGLLDL